MLPCPALVIISRARRKRLAWPGYRVYDDFMVARLTGSDGLLRKIVYPDALKIAKETPVDGNRRYLLPAALLD